MRGVHVSSIVNEGIKTILNLFYFFLREDFTRTKKHTKSIKSVKNIKYVKATKNVKSITSIKSVKGTKSVKRVKSVKSTKRQTSDFLPLLRLFCFCSLAYFLYAFCACETFS